MKLTSMKVQALCIFVLILVVGTSSQHVNCPFDYIYHFGDTTTDIGNAILIDPHLPAAYLPFGKTNPGYPTGRWCDGYIDFDFESRAYNLSNIVPYLGLNGSTKYDGVMFSVAWSPVLDRPFFESRGIEIPLYCVSLNGQLQWFKEHINNIAPTPEAVAERLQQSIFFTGDLEANDLVYGLTQGKSIEEVKTYVPYIVEALLNFLRELIAMGASRIVVPGNFPIGCTPYILTELGTDDPKDYDDIGCLHTVNELIQYKNQAVEDAINKEFPNTVVSYADNYGVVYSYINTTFNGPHGNITLQACCGVGGKYNFDSKRFCGHPEATVCSSPNDSVWWDGMHHTEGTYNNILSNLINASLASVNCTISPQLSASAQLSASI